MPNGTIEFCKPIDFQTKVTRINEVGLTIVTGGTIVAKGDMAGMVTQMRLMFNNRNATRTVTYGVFGSMLDKPNSDPTTQDWVQIGVDAVVAPSSSAMVKYDFTGVRHILLKGTAGVGNTNLDNDIVGYGVNL